VIDKVVTFGEIMLRLAPPNCQRFTQARSFDLIYGGGEANVAVSLANFGVDVEFITRVPANDLGDACLQFLRQYGVGVSRVLRGGSRLGIYFLEMGSMQRPSKVIYDRELLQSPRSNQAWSIGKIYFPEWAGSLDWYHARDLQRNSRGLPRSCARARRLD